MKDLIIKNIDVFMIGRRTNYAIPRLLYEEKILGEFITDYRRKELKAEPFGKKAKHTPILALIIAVIRKLWMSEDRRAIYYVFNIILGVRFSSLASGGGSKICICFCGGALEIFKSNLYQVKILEQFIVSHADQQERIYKKKKIGLIGRMIHKKLQERERREWELADLIVIPSKVVKNSLIKSGVPPEKLRIISYGVGTVFNAPLKRLITKPLMVLFVGEVGYRKGAPEIIEAARNYSPDQVQIHMYGRVNLPSSVLSSLPPNVVLGGKVSSDILALEYANCHVLLLPSRAEGSATVFYEAINFNMPAIYSTYSGYPKEVESYGVEVQCSVADISKAIDKLLNNPELLNELSSDICKNKGVLTYAGFKTRWLEFLSEISL